jgi:hypothetical protein
MATEFRDPPSTDGNDAGGNTIDPSGLVGETAPEPAARVRKPRSDAGKPRGSRTAQKAKTSTSSLDLSGLAGILVGLTETIAAWRDVPEIGLDESEAKNLMVATQNVLRHYSVETTQKGADFIALFGVISMTVGTRIGAYNIRVRAEKAERMQQPRQTFRPTVVQPQTQAPQSAPQAPMPRPEPQFTDLDGSGGGF